MIGIWNGQELAFKEVGPTSKEVFAAARSAIDGGYIEIVPNSYTRVSNTLARMKSAGIVVMMDEDGQNKQLHPSWFVGMVTFVGNVVFTGIRNSHFRPLTEEQKQFLTEYFKLYKTQVMGAEA